MHRLSCVSFLARYLELLFRCLMQCVARKENVFAVAVKVADADADDAAAALLRQHSLP